MLWSRGWNGAFGAGLEHLVLLNITAFNTVKQSHEQLDGCIVWNAHNTVLGEEARLIYIVPVCYT